MSHRSDLYSERGMRRHWCARQALRRRDAVNLAYSAIAYFVEHRPPRAFHKDHAGYPSAAQCIAAMALAKGKQEKLTAAEAA